MEKIEVVRWSSRMTSEIIIDALQTQAPYHRRAHGSLTMIRSKETYPVLSSPLPSPAVFLPFIVLLDFQPAHVRCLPTSRASTHAKQPNPRARRCGLTRPTQPPFFFSGRATGALTFQPKCDLSPR